MEPCCGVGVADAWGCGGRFGGGIFIPGMFIPGMACIGWSCDSPDPGPLWSPAFCAWAACARLWRVRSVRASRPKLCGKGRVRAAGARGLAGLSAPRGGGGLLAQPARRLKTKKGIKTGRAIYFRDDGVAFRPAGQAFRRAGTPGGAPGRRPARCKPRSRNRRGQRPGSARSGARPLSAI